MFFMFKQERFWLAVMLLAALAMAGWIGITRAHMNADSLYYLIPTRNLLAGDGLTYNGESHTVFPPGYGLVTYPLYRIVGDFETAGILVSVVLYVALVGLVYAVGRWIYHDSSALAAAFFTLISPVLLIQAGQAMTDILFTFLYFLAFCVYLRAVYHRRLTPAWAAALGFLLGLLYLTRPEALALVAVVGGSLALWTLRSHARDFSAWLSVGLVGVVFVLMAAPYILFLHDALGEWTISGKVRQNIIRDENVALYEDASVGEFFEEEGWDYVTRVLTNWKDSVIQLVGMNRGVFLLVGAVGLLHLALRRKLLPSLDWDERKSQAAWVQLLFFLPILAYAFFYLEYRFFLAQSLIMFLPLAYFVGRGLADLLPASPRIPVLLAACLLMLPAYFYFLVPIFKDASLDTAFTGYIHLREAKDVGTWVYEHTENPKEAYIIAPGKANLVAYYAAGREEQDFAWMPQEMTAAELRAAMQKGEYDYLVIEESYRGYNAAALALWNDPALAEEYGLTLLHQEDRFQVYAPASEES
jgi:4-amino-4-deoxy-L-arabinose transferase-like glycosyltransferase